MNGILEIATRLPDAWFVAMANEAGEVYAVFDLAFRNREEAEKRCAVCQRLLGSWPDDLFSESSWFFPMSSERFVQECNCPDEFGPDWSKAEELSLGECGGVLTFCGVPRAEKAAWRQAAELA